MLFGQPDWEPLTPAEFFRIRTTPAYRKAVRWSRIWLGLVALLPIDLLGWGFFHQADASETVLTVVVFVALYAQLKAIVFMRRAGIWSWARLGAAALNARFGPAPPPLMTRPMRMRRLRDIFLPRQEYTLGSENEMPHETDP